MITKLYSEYIQKSRIFLYPILEIKKGSDAVPIESYVSWQDVYHMAQMKFICVYHLRNDDAFKKFEKNKLTNHKLFDCYYETKDEKGVYIFDLAEYKDDWTYFLDGKYSQLSVPTKNLILKFFINNKNNYHHINSYLNPEIYYEQYAKLLNINENILREVGELCNPPDLIKENLVSEVKPIPLFYTI
jgi:hypothetical protein